jgi:hypothetical protein
MALLEGTIAQIDNSIVPRPYGTRALVQYSAAVHQASERTVSNAHNPLADWTPEQIAEARLWVETWQRAGVELERIRREELRSLDTYAAIEMLCGDADYTKPPYAPLPTSGLVEQQRWFMKAAGRE